MPGTVYSEPAEGVITAEPAVWDGRKLGTYVAKGDPWKYELRTDGAYAIKPGTGEAFPMGKWMPRLLMRIDAGQTVHEDDQYLEDRYGDLEPTPMELPKEFPEPEEPRPPERERYLRAVKSAMAQHKS